ncbi:MAG TPA: UvrB/UvrC motif-containing protein, partial [Nitrososphaeraceae archaeon]|nr:UvrB/UvrC motif-containing protein [Nitrososphaeraceae archaeon]
HKITPISILKPIITNQNSQSQRETFKSMSKNDLRKLSVETEALMNKFAEQLEFEKAIQLRDKLKKINQEIGIVEVSRS